MNDSAADIRFEVRITRDIEYATARIGYNGGAGPMTARALTLDCYQPVGASGQVPASLPALVLAFGGAFHRGSKDNDVRPEDGPKNTSIADYCARFAARGYCCFSIDYRLTQEDPHPGHTPTLGPEPVPTSRIDIVRKLLDLPPATSQMLANEQEAAIDDVVSAYRFVTGESRSFNIDPSRVGIGGFSAGGRISAMAAMAERISPAVVVALSGIAMPSAVKRFHASGRHRMPIFIAYGENDLDYVIPGAKAMITLLETAEHPHQACVLPGQSHFYDAASSVVSSVGDPQSLEHAIEQFLARHL